MTTEIYADSLFAVNFSMDFLALFITAKTLHAAVRPLRLVTAALLGAAFATAMVVFDRDELIVKIIWWTAFISCAAAMCAIAYGGTLLKEIPVFMAVNLGLGGIMSALYGLVRRSGIMFAPENQSSDADSMDARTASPLLFIIFAGASGAISLIYGRIRQSRVKRREITAELEIFGSKKSLRLLVDSGNLLCEPISGRPVIIVSKRTLKELLPPNLSISELSASAEPGIMRRIRLIPARGVMGGGLMTGIVPDKVSAQGRDVDTVIALTDEEFGDCDGIIPEILLI